MNVAVLFSCSKKDPTCGPLDGQVTQRPFTGLDSKSIPGASVQPQ